MLNYELLNKIIQENGGSRIEFARRTGITKSYVSKILDKKCKNISIQTAVKIANAYNISLDILILKN